MQKQILITREAEKVLRKQKKEGYSLKLLASEAIINYFGSTAAQTESVSAENFAQELLKENSVEEAVKKLDGYLPNHPELKENVRKILLNAQ